MVAFNRAPAEITSPSVLPAADLTGFDPKRTFKLPEASASWSALG